MSASLYAAALLASLRCQRDDTVEHRAERDTTIRQFVLSGGALPIDTAALVEADERVRAEFERDAREGRCRCWRCVLPAAIAGTGTASAEVSQ